MCTKTVDLSKLGKCMRVHDSVRHTTGDDVIVIEHVICTIFIYKQSVYIYHTYVCIEAMLRQSRVIGET